MEIRKFIYKYEIEYLFTKYTIQEEIISKIINNLFTNPSSIDRNIQYYLKLTNINNVDEVLSDLNIDSNLKGAIKSLLIVDYDLHMPLDLKTNILEDKPVAIFVGAGVSKLVGYPLWGELGISSLEYLKEKRELNEFEFDKIRKEISDPKQILSIFDKRYPRSHAEGKRFYTEQLGDRSTKNYNPIPFDLLVSPVFRWLIVTSNVDYEFREAKRRMLNKPNPEITKNFSPAEELKTIERQPKIISKDFDSNSIISDAIYQIHGELDKLEETIFTTEDYINNYYSEASDLRGFLTKLFESYTVVFLGYGLADFPILDTIIASKSPEEANRHYALVPTYLNEMNLFNFKKDYFGSLNITPLPYYLDSEGHHRLSSVLQHWETEIRAGRQTDFIDDLNFIDSVL